MHRVIEKQFRDFLESKGLKPDTLNSSQLEGLKANYSNEMYPGSKLPPEKIISQLTSQNPEVTLSSEVLVDKGYDECKNLAGTDNSQDLSCPDTPSPWTRFELLKDGITKIICINEDTTFGLMTTGGGSSFTQALDSTCGTATGVCPPPPPNKKKRQAAASELTGNTCTLYGANRLRFSLQDSGLQEMLFELYCDSLDPTKCKLALKMHAQFSRNY